MKKKVMGLTLGLVLSIAVTACGGDAGQNGIEGAENQSAQTMVETGEQNPQPNDELESVQDATSKETEAAKQEPVDVTESTEDVWVPKEFVLNENVELNFVAPAVHTGVEEQCTFMWSYTEEDLKNWFLERYAHVGEQVTEYVGNYQKRDNTYRRSYSLSKNDYAVSKNVSMSIDTGIYHESVAHAVSFYISDTSQETVIEETLTVLEMLGLGDCAEEIIHSDAGVLEVPTENGKGYYMITSSYSTSEYSRTYGIRVSVTYNDYEGAYYEQYFWDNKPVNFEYWDEYFSLGDYLSNCELDTTDTVIFDEAQKAYKEALYGNVYDREESLEQSFVYRRYDFETLDDVEFEYWSRCQDDEAEGGALSLKHTIDDDRIEFHVTVYGRPPFEDREEKRYISRGDDLTDAEIQELCQARYDLMKKLDSTIDWTTQDLINAFRYAEFREDNDKIRFYGDGYEYHIMNDLDGFALYGRY